VTWSAARDADIRELRALQASGAGQEGGAFRQGATFPTPSSNANFGAHASTAGPMREAELVEKNHVLQEKLERLQDQTPAHQRAQLQRLDFLEKSGRALEAERSALLVRATVAEEQLTELHRHLKDMTKSYQMEILNLKLEAQRAR